MQTLGDLVKKGTSGGLFCKMILDGKTFSYTFRESVKKVINNVVNECGSRESNTIFIPEKEVLSICSIIKKSREQDSVIIFDEPEARLHPAAVSDLLDIIMLLAENGMYLENQATQPEEAAEQISDNTPAGFVPVRSKSYSYRWEELQDYEALIKAFYAVDSTTQAGEELLGAEKLLSRDMRLQGGTDKPQILIYHTHSQEAFADSVPGDESTSIVGVGEHLASILRQRYGYNVMHFTESFDKESRDYAYGNSLPVIEKLLAEYPSIEVVIDLHRDAMPESRRLVMDLQGKPTAQIMFFNGLSRTAKGEIEYLENPYLDDNLAFSFQMQAACNEYYPGLARRIYLKAYRYNMHLCPKTLLIELGAQNNTVEEMKNACEPLAHVLSLVLNGEEPKR